MIVWISNYISRSSVDVITCLYHNLKHNNLKKNEQPYANILADVSWKNNSSHFTIDIVKSMLTVSSTGNDFSC